MQSEAREDDGLSESIDGFAGIAHSIPFNTTERFCSGDYD
jgi:hypothetical protein